MLEFLGFTTTEGILWNSIAYVAFAGVITGLLLEKYINTLFFVGALVFAGYSHFFLGNTIFTILQILCALSAFLLLVKVKQEYTAVLITGLLSIACIYMLATKGIPDAETYVGIIGLTAITFGIISLPLRPGFLLLMWGSAFMALYAWSISAQVFLFLNIVSSFVNAWKWYKTPLLKKT